MGTNFEKLANKLKEKYKEDEIILTDDILKEYLLIYGDKAINKIRVISDLKKQNIITTLDRERVVFKSSKKFIIKNTEETLDIYNKFKKEYPLLNLLVWDTEFLSNFMLHQIFKNMIIVEVEKIGLEVTHAFLIDFYNDKYTIITEKMLENNQIPYFPKKRIILKQLIFGSPTQKESNENAPKFEKVLVDLFIDKMYIAYQGHELNFIYENAFTYWDINLTTFYGYAYKRNVKEKIKEFVNKLQIPERYKL